MSDDKRDRQQKVPLEGKAKVELGGGDAIGTTSNQRISGYEGSGDIENAGELVKGFKRPANTPIHKEYEDQ